MKIPICRLGRILILDVGDDHVILSSEHKIRLGITLGLVNEPVSLDGIKSVAILGKQLLLLKYLML